PTAVADFLVDRMLYFETGMTGMLVHIHNGMLTSFSARKDRLSTFKEMVAMRPIARCRLERGKLHAATGQFARFASDRTSMSRAELQGHAHHLGLLPRHKLAQVEEARMRAHSTALAGIAQRGFQLLLGKLHGLDEAVRFLDPDRLLQRGFSIARKDGFPVTDVGQLRAGDELETTFAHGKTWSTIQKIDPHGKG